VSSKGFLFKEAINKQLTLDFFVNKCVGINNFGFGGSNAHAILQHHPPTPRESLEENATYPRYFPFIISGHTHKATEELANLLAEKIDSLQKQNRLNETHLLDLSYTLCCRRNLFAHRCAFVSSKDGVKLLGDLKSTQFVKIEHYEEEKKICFVYTGQGAQYFAMGRELINTEPFFHESMMECDTILKRYVTWSLIEELAKSETDSNINRVDVSQPACTALQISLTRLWSKYGVHPKVVVGHSSGEIAAAYCAGMLTLENAMLAAIFRGIALKETKPDIPGMFFLFRLFVCV
jgi:acyl transferase domain-containing protein